MVKRTLVITKPVLKPYDSADRIDLNLGVRLSVTLLLLFVLLGLVLEHNDLLCLCVAKNGTAYLAAVHIRLAGLDAVFVSKSNNVEINLCVFFGSELFNKNHVADTYLVLLSAGFDYCVHEKHLSFIIRLAERRFSCKRA